MGLDLLPKHAGTGKFEGIPVHLTHRPGSPCPVEKEHFSVGTWTCCWFRGKAAACELEALGETQLAKDMYTDMSPLQAAEFASRLRSAADHLEELHKHSTHKPEGYPWNTMTENPTTGQMEVVSLRTPFSEALTVIREAARWYELMADMGIGVHAWY